VLRACEKTVPWKSHVVGGWILLLSDAKVVGPAVQRAREALEKEREKVKT
jgi:hypothetical protein